MSVREEYDETYQREKAKYAAKHREMMLHAFGNDYNNRQKPFDGLEKAAEARVEKLNDMARAIEARKAINEIRKTLGDAAADEAQRKINAKLAELSPDTMRTLASLGVDDVAGVTIKAPPGEGPSLKRDPDQATVGSDGNALAAASLYKVYNTTKDETLKSEVAKQLFLAGYRVNKASGALEKATYPVTPKAGTSPVDGPRGDMGADLMAAQGNGGNE